MLPTETVRLQLGALLAADATTLAPVTNANKIALIAAPFSLVETIPLASLTLATFTGATPKAGETGPQEVGLDPVTGMQVIQISPPVGGYRWITGDTVNLPQTIYGFCLLDSTLAILLAIAQLPVPITLTAAGQFIEIDPVNLTIVSQPVS